MQPGSLPRNILIHSSFIYPWKTAFRTGEVWTRGSNHHSHSQFLHWLWLPQLFGGNSLEYSRRKKNSWGLQTVYEISQLSIVVFSQTSGSVFTIYRTRWQWLPCLMPLSSLLIYLYLKPTKETVILVIQKLNVEFSKLSITFKTRYPELLLWQNIQKSKMRHEKEC